MDLPKPTFETSRKSDPPSTPSTPSADDSARDDGAHLDAIQMPDIEGDGSADPDGPIAVDDEGQPVDASPERIDKEAFWIVFETAFSIPGSLKPEFAPLAIQPQEQGPGRAASDAVHSLLEIYYPRALMPGSETLAHLLVAGPFLIGKAMVVREIMRARAAPPRRKAGPVEVDQGRPSGDPGKPSGRDPMAWMDEEEQAA